MFQLVGFEDHCWLVSAKWNSKCRKWLWVGVI